MSAGESRMQESWGWQDLQGWQPLCEDLKEAREELRTSPGRRDQPEQRPREGAAREEEGWTQVRVGTWAERTGRR